MDTKELEKFCPWARIRLIDEVRQRCYVYGLDDAGRKEFDRDATIVKGAVLSALERSQRSELYRRIEQAGYTHFCEEMPTPGLIDLPQYAIWRYRAICLVACAC